MKVFVEHSHNKAAALIQTAGVSDDLHYALTVPGQRIHKGCAAAVKRAVRERLRSRGWVMKPRVATSYKLDINALKCKIGLTVQTGNIARAYYDFFKMESMFKSGRLIAGVLAVPTAGAAQAIGSNIANYERLVSELTLFRAQLSIPLLVLGFDEE